MALIALKGLAPLPDEAARPADDLLKYVAGVLTKTGVSDADDDADSRGVARALRAATRVESAAPFCIKLELETDAAARALLSRAARLSKAGATSAAIRAALQANAQRAESAGMMNADITVEAWTDTTLSVDFLVF